MCVRPLRQANCAGFLRLRGLFWTLAVCGLAAAVAFLSFRRAPSRALFQPQPAAGPMAPSPPSPASLGMAAAPPERSPFGVLADRSATLAQRRQAVETLARLGSAEALAALKAALPGASPVLKVAIGEALGDCASPQARALLLEMLQGADPDTQRAAVRGLAVRADAEAADLLAQVLADAGRTMNVRAESALALGELSQPGALEALEEAVTQSSDDLLVESALQGLGKRPISETESFFRDYLASESVATESKVEALQALASVQGDPSALLLQYAASSEPELRAAAVETLCGLQDQTNLGADLLGLLQKENDPDLRAQLYSGLQSQDSVDAAALLAVVQQESNPVARLAALELLASLCSGENMAAVQQYFDTAAVPELQKLALEGSSLQQQLQATRDLKAAATPQALQALSLIALKTSDPQVAEVARSAAGQVSGR